MEAVVMSKEELYVYLLEGKKMRKKYWVKDAYIVRIKEGNVVYVEGDKKTVLCSLKDWKELSHTPLIQSTSIIGVGDQWEEYSDHQREEYLSIAIKYGTIITIVTTCLLFMFIMILTAI